MRLSYIPLLTAALLAFAVALARPAHAQTEFTSPRAIGMGNAFVAGNSNGALYHNPAGILTASVYSLETGYQFSDADNSHAMSVSIVDAKTNPWIAAGGGFSYAIGNGGSDGKTDDVRDYNVRAALAAPLVPRHLSLGVGARYANYRLGVNDADGDPIRENPFTLDAGLVGTINGKASIAFAAQNLLQPDGVVGSRRFTTGGALFLGPVHVEAQYVTAEITETVVSGNDSEGGTIGLGGSSSSQTRTSGTGEWGHGFGLGLEVNAGPVPIRAGTSRDPVTGDFRVGGGFGFRSDFAGFDAGFIQNVSKGMGTDRYFGISASFFL